MTHDDSRHTFNTLFDGCHGGHEPVARLAQDRLHEKSVHQHLAGLHDAHHQCLLRGCQPPPPPHAPRIEVAPSQPPPPHAHSAKRPLLGCASDLQKHLAVHVDLLGGGLDLGGRFRGGSAQDAQFGPFASAPQDKSAAPAASRVSLVDAAPPTSVCSAADLEKVGLSLTTVLGSHASCSASRSLTSTSDWISVPAGTPRTGRHWSVGAPEHVEGRVLLARARGHLEHARQLSRGNRCALLQLVHRERRRFVELEEDGRLERRCMQLIPARCKIDANVGWPLPKYVRGHVRRGRAYARELHVPAPERPGSHASEPLRAPRARWWSHVSRRPR